MTVLFANNATTTVAGSITPTSNQVNVAGGTGIQFPSPTGGDYFCMTFYDVATASRYEIVHVTARTLDTMTIARAQEGTQAQSWSQGDIAAALLTAGSLNNFLQTGTGLNTSVIYEGADTSTTSNALVVPVINPTAGSAPRNGMNLLITPNRANVRTINLGACTLALLNLGPRPIVGLNGLPLQGGELVASYPQLLTRIGDAEASCMYQLAQLPISDGRVIHIGTDTGTVNAVNVTALNLFPAPAAYAAGQQFNVYIAVSNTGPATANFGGLGAKNCRRLTGAALAAGDLVAGQMAIFIYNATAGAFSVIGGNSIGQAGAPGAAGTPGNPGATGPTGAAGTMNTYGQPGSVYMEYRTNQYTTGSGTTSYLNHAKEYYGGHWQQIGDMTWLNSQLTAAAMATFQRDY